MLKYFLFVTLVGGVCAAGEIDIHTEVYVVAGVLGGVCLILTIATIINSVTIVSLQSKVTVLRRAVTASSAMDADAEIPSHPRDDNPLRRDLRYAPYGGKEDYRRHDGPADNYRRPQENYRMDRFTGNHYHEDRRYPGGPVPPPRPSHRQDSRIDGYY